MWLQQAEFGQLLPAQSRVEVFSNAVGAPGYLWGDPTVREHKEG